jgi:cytochrome c5
MKTPFIVLLGVLLLACAAKVFAWPQSQAAPQKVAKNGKDKNADTNEGEKRFQANCGRCHNPPDSISPREVKAVLQHMRVRAMLSAQDEQLILKYLAP